MHHSKTSMQSSIYSAFIVMPYSYVSYRAHTTVVPGRVAAIAEDRKQEKY